MTGGGELEEILTGTDQPVSIFLRDDFDAVINPNTDLTGVLVYIYYENGEILAKYSLNSKTDFEEVAVVDAANGEIETKLQSWMTAGKREGLIFAEVKAQESNASYKDGTFDSGVRDMLLGKLVKAHSAHKEP